MSKTSRRQGREEIKKQKKERKRAQKELRKKQKDAGFDVLPQRSMANGTSSYKTVEEEKGARLDALTQQIKTYRAVLPDLLKRLAKIDDPRNPKKIKHKMSVLMLYGILCFVFQLSSRREANRKMTRPMFEKNLRILFPELEKLPHNDTLARILNRIDVSEIEQAHIAMIKKLIRKKKFRNYLINGCYPIAIDGTQKFARNQCWGQECLERKVKTKKKAKKDDEEPVEKRQYYVYVLEANLAFHNGMVIPLLSEVLNYTQGDNDKDKQDCETRAFKRLAKRLKENFSHLSIMVLLDGLYPNGPIIELCRKNKWDFMIVLQDKSLTTVWDEMKGLKKLQPNNRLTMKWGDRKQSYRWVNGIEYEYCCPITGKDKKQTLHVVVCTERWEEIAPDSSEVINKISRHVWISEQPLNKRNIHKRCNLGARHRWGIESSFLVEKHQGYCYEHCHSYEWNAMCGYHYLMRLAHAINVLARYTYALGKYVSELGIRGLIDFVRETIAAPWIDAETLRQIATSPCQIRME